MSQETSSPTAEPAETELFPPGCLVLTKIKGFSPWPSMVLPDTVAPESILKKKPKLGLSTTRLRKEMKKRKDKATEEELLRVYLVKFFYDDNYQWVSGIDLSRLPEDSLIRPKRVSRALETAYGFAYNPPSLEDFSLYGSTGVPPPEPEQPIVTEEEEEISPLSKSKKRKAANGTKATKKAKRSAPLKKEAEVEEFEESSQESDYGAELETELRSSIKELELEYNELVDESSWPTNPYMTTEEIEVANSAEDVPISADLVKTSNYQTLQLMKLRRGLAQYVMEPSEEINFGDLDSIITGFVKEHNIEEFALSLLYRLKIDRVFGVLLKRSDLENKLWKKTRKTLQETFTTLFQFDVSKEAAYTTTVEPLVESTKKEDEAEIPKTSET